MKTIIRTNTKASLYQQPTIYIHGSSTLSTMLMMSDHIKYIHNNIKGGLLKIEYYPSDYYSEITIDTDVNGSFNDGFNDQKIEQAMSYLKYKCSFKEFSNANAIFTIQGRFYN